MPLVFFFLWLATAPTALYFLARAQKRGPNRARFLAAGALLLAIWLGVLGWFRREMRAQDNLVQCRQNMRNISTACDMYSTDNQGNYPDRLERIVPQYLKEIPRCPSAQTDTYSSTYQYTLVHSPHDIILGYTLCCGGVHHKDAGVTEPDSLRTGTWCAPSMISPSDRKFPN